MNRGAHNWFLLYCVSHTEPHSQSTVSLPFGARLCAAWAPASRPVRAQRAFARGGGRTGGTREWFPFPWAWLLCQAHQGSVYKIGIQVLRKKKKKYTQCARLDGTHCTGQKPLPRRLPLNCLEAAGPSWGKAQRKVKGMLFQKKVFLF